MRKNNKDQFVRHLSKVIAGAVREVERVHGRVLPESVAKRVASQLWTQTQNKAHSNTATWVKHIRNMLGLTQTEMAKKLRTTQVTIARWENSISIPSPKMRKALENLGKEVQST